MASPELLSIDVADSETGWTSAGFSVEDAQIDVGGITVRLDQPVQSTSWSFAGLRNPDATEIDGIMVTTFEGRPSNDSTPANPNGVFHLDHVVMMSPDLRRTVPELESHGFEVRRRRDVGKGREQVFLWAGRSIIELVGPTSPTTASDEPSSLWGLAMSTSDIDAAATRLGAHLGQIKDAVQAGRRIATVRTADLGITPTIAVMTPHK